MGQQIILLLTSRFCVQDVTFHQCVNLGRFNTEKVVSFVPPDGEFDLMKYRCQEGISLPFRVLPIINEMGRTRLEVPAPDSPLVHCSATAADALRCFKGDPEYGQPTPK